MLVRVRLAQPLEPLLAAQTQREQSRCSWAALKP
jgi:hypothetical protein